MIVLLRMFGALVLAWWVSPWLWNPENVWRLPIAVLFSMLFSEWLYDDGYIQGRFAKEREGGCLTLILLLVAVPQLTVYYFGTIGGYIYIFLLFWFISGLKQVTIRKK
jgi:hypothetical protein